MFANMLALISAEGLVETVVWLLGLGLIVWLLLYLVSYIGVPEPFNKIIKIVIMVFAVLVLINLVLGLMGHPLVGWTSSGHGVLVN